MNILWGNETLFKNESVLDPEYIPEILMHRDGQMNAVAANLKPAIRGHSPVNTVCLGPPSTGKTSVVRYLFKSSGITAMFLLCTCDPPVLRTEYNILAKIYENICGKMAPQKGVPIDWLLSGICKKLLDEDRPAVIALDDFNYVDVKVINSLLYDLLKLSDEYSVKLGVICIITDLSFVIKLDPFVGSIFHHNEVYFPVYSSGEVADILRQRIELGFHEGVVSDEAFERIVDITASTCDLRFGIYLLRQAGIEAERRVSRKIELRDVEKVYKGGAKIFLAKSISVLNSDEREALKIIYSLEEDITAGELFKIMREEVGLYYEKFYEIISKLERLRLVDVIFGKKGKGRTRYIIKRYDKKVMLEALKEF